MTRLASGPAAPFTGKLPAGGLGTHASPMLAANICYQELSTIANGQKDAAFFFFGRAVMTGSWAQTGRAAKLDHSVNMSEPAAVSSEGRL